MNAPGESDRRSGDYSKDPRFDPDSHFEPAGVVQGHEDVSAAMGLYLDRGETDRFASEIAIFVRDARSRGEPVEVVLATLNRIAVEHQGHARLGTERSPTALSMLILKGLLLAFYGETAGEPDSAPGRNHR